MKKIDRDVLVWAVLFWTLVAIAVAPMAAWVCFQANHPLVSDS
ncbi:MAG: hypothetical protein ACAH95_17155 [Fimbriimonas sp.]